MIDVRSTPDEPIGFLNDWDMAEWERDLLSGDGASQPGVSVGSNLNHFKPAMLIMRR